jgi:excisionase family DNA binding protein
MSPTAAMVIRVAAPARPVVDVGGVVGTVVDGGAAVDTVRPGPTVVDSDGAAARVVPATTREDPGAAALPERHNRKPAAPTATTVTSTSTFLNQRFTLMILPVDGPDEQGAGAEDAPGRPRVLTRGPRPIPFGSNRPCLRELSTVHRACCANRNGFVQYCRNSCATRAMDRGGTTIDKPSPRDTGDGPGGRVDDQVDDQRLVRPREAAERLGISLRTVYLWIASGRLQAVKLSMNGTRVLEDSIARVIESPEYAARRPLGPGVDAWVEWMRSKRSVRPAPYWAFDTLAMNAWLAREPEAQDGRVRRMLERGDPEDVALVLQRHPRDELIRILSKTGDMDGRAAGAWLNLLAPEPGPEPEPRPGPEPETPRSRTPALHLETLDGRSVELLARVGESRQLAGFYLGGGTGAALLMGHRRPADVELFSERPWSSGWLEAALRKVGVLAVDRLERGRLTGRVDGTPVTVSYHPYLLIDELLPSPWGIPRADVRDLAASNLLALSEYGSRERFVDLSLLAEWGIDARETLDLLRFADLGVYHNPVHVARSLSYFADAEAEPLPDLLVPLDWPLVTRRCLTEAREILRAAGILLPGASS